MRTIGLGIMIVWLTAGCMGGLSNYLKKPTSIFHDKPLPLWDGEKVSSKALKPSLPFPCRVAVYFNPPAYSHWRWSAKDRTELESCGESLVVEGIASDIFVMPSMLIDGKESNRLDLREIRDAAAKQGADAVFVIGAIPNATITKNWLAMLDPTILGGYLVHGSQCDAVFGIQGGLIDVFSGYLYLSIESAARARIFGPSFLIGQKEAFEEAKSEAFTSFVRQIVPRIRGVRDSMAQAPAPMGGLGPIQEIDPKTGKPLSK
jgi:hypothetical protein